MDCCNFIVYPLNTCQNCCIDVCQRCCLQCSECENIHCIWCIEDFINEKCAACLIVDHIDDKETKYICYNCYENKEQFQNS